MQSHTSDARLIKIIEAVLRREARKHHCKAKTRGSKPASQHHCKAKTQGSKPASQLHCKAKTRGLKPTTQQISTPASQYHSNAKTQGSRPASSIISMAKRRAQAHVSTAEEPCFSVITALITGSSTTHVMRRVNPHYKGFLGNNFTPRTPINS